jgi:hypothetical protein
LPRAPRFLYQQAGGNFAEANQVGAKMVGRMRAGDPLLPIQTEPIRELIQARLPRINLHTKAIRLAHDVRSAPISGERIRATAISLSNASVLLENSSRCWASVRGGFTMI